MGKFRDWCVATGESDKEWLARDNQPKTSGLKGKSYRLPKPYNVDTPNSENERMIQKLGLSIMADCFTFSTRLEGGGKIVSVGGSQRMVGSSQRGLPDAIGVRKGILYGIEFKKAGGHVSAIQYAKLKELHQAGARVCICVSPIKIREWVNIGTYTCKIDDWLEVL